MLFTLQSLLISFVIVASALAAFGPGGLVVAAFIIAIAAVIRTSESMGKTILIVLIIFFILLILLLPAMQSARESGRRAQCMNNLKQISLALLHYESVHGHFPPAYIAGPDGKPWHSWRVLILPYLDQKALYEKYNFDEPWNGPNNSKLAQTIIKIYRCPSDSTAVNNAQTNYFAVIGEETVWPTGKSVKLSDISDGTDKTILLIEMPNSGINWMEPQDVKLEDISDNIDSKISAKMFTSHSYKPNRFYLPQTGDNVAFTDGSVQYLNKNYFSSNARALCSRASNDYINKISVFDGIYYLDWPFITALIILVLSTALLILRPRNRKTANQAKSE